MTTQELKQSIEQVLGNNIRCLLPSYWWKRLFNQVADRIDEVEQSTSELIEASKMPIVASENKLSQLDLPKGSVAAVGEVGESKTVKISDCYFSANVEEDWEKYTIVKRVEEKANITIDKDNVVAFSASKDWLNGDFQVAALDSGIFVYLRYIDGHYIDTTLSEVNEALSSGKYRATLYENAPDDYFTFYSEIPQPELYIKGDSWERFAKESDLDEVGGGVVVDSEMSDTSTNAVQNKVVTEALNNKVDKVSGKQLSTEDFTTALKTKLEGLNAFDPTEINNKVDGLQTQLNTLVSGDASTAIESFNEITAFLNGVTDSETLDGIIAGIEQQIANKQDKLVSGTNIKTINGEPILGEGNIVVNVDTSNLATKEEVTNLQNEVIANEEVSAAAFNEINERINAISENVGGTTVTKEEFESTVTTINESIATKQDTLVSGTSIKTINGVSVLGEGDIEINVDTSSLATKEELESLTNEVITNEEVVAAAFNEINERINEAVLEVDNKIASSITNAINASY